MDIQLPPNAIQAFNQGNKFAIDNGRILAYGLRKVTIAMVEDVCEQVTKSYAKEILKWPNGRLEKPEIFKAVDQGPFENLNACCEHFIRYLHAMFNSSPPYQIPTFPHAFIAVSRDDMPSKVVLAVAYQVYGLWKLEHRLVPVNAELGLHIESLRMGDEDPIDLLNNYTYDPAKKISINDKIHPRYSNEWAFAVFSTGLGPARSLLSLIDPLTDEVQPSGARINLMSDPKTRRKQMTGQRMKQLFPIICRDDELRNWRTNGMKLHKRVLICCDNDNPKEKGVLVMRMEWDGNTNKDDEELKNAGEATKVHETRVAVDEALARANEIAKRGR
ncbi:hypothetical protein PHISCL_00764 [Aspergillus sclerotialis]|uniref:Uncharacterized protein n=1 Tax=Aspergillus sclerotialis TaxID=2070753 RepID=A0A3A2ZUM9_9EURO|nr:hypothetical protein PHISCL_00764 [Aspergillus sclerotialis]